MSHLTAQITLAFIFGVTFMATLIVLAIRFPSPTPFQYTTFRVASSLAAAGVAAVIPGFIDLDLNPAAGLLIRAGGALAVFVIVFFFNPAQLAVHDPLAAQPLDLVAAVCYRFAGESVEFLLIKTAGGRWTFPKGNVKPGEEKWFAAQREARKEAGVSGQIEREPFATYLHQKKGWKRLGLEVPVQAFLLCVEKTKKPREKHRKRKWFSPDQAASALAKHRPFKYAEESRRVVREATKRLEHVARPPQHAAEPGWFASEGQSGHP